MRNVRCGGVRRVKPSHRNHIFRFMDLGGSMGLDFIGLIGQCHHLSVAAAITIHHQTVSGTVRLQCQETVHFFLTFTVFRGKNACQMSRPVHFWDGAYHTTDTSLLAPRTNPRLHARADHIDPMTLCQMMTHVVCQPLISKTVESWQEVAPHLSEILFPPMTKEKRKQFLFHIPPTHYSQRHE